jgi:cell division protein FtsW (lipid II flippase)
MVCILIYIIITLLIVGGLQIAAGQAKDKGLDMTYRALINPIFRGALIFLCSFIFTLLKLEFWWVWLTLFVIWCVVIYLWHKHHKES